MCDNLPRLIDMQNAPIFRRKFAAVISRFNEIEAEKTRNVRFIISFKLQVLSVPHKLLNSKIRLNAYQVVEKKRR